MHQDKNRFIITDEDEGEVVVSGEEDEGLPTPQPTSKTIIVPGEEWVHEDELEGLTEEDKEKVKTLVEDETILDKFGKVGKAHTLGRGKRTQDFLINDDQGLIRDKNYRVKPIKGREKGKPRKG